jgi:hypothetical protein
MDLMNTSNIFSRSGDRVPMRHVTRISDRLSRNKPSVIWPHQFFHPLL